MIYLLIRNNRISNYEYKNKLLIQQKVKLFFVKNLPLLQISL